MSHDTDDRLASLLRRTHELEERYTHLQRTVEDLNEVVIDQGRKIDQLERHMALYARQLGALSERVPEPRTLEEDRPPHY